jgi:hypothetical protein
MTELMMTRRMPADIARFKAQELDPDIAGFCRAVTTFFGLHRSCPFGVCRRAGACATRNAVCYQMLEEEMRPIMLSISARSWMEDVKSGVEIDVAPAHVDDMTRLLAWEEREMARIATCELSDGDLSPYQLWLRMVARSEPRAPLAAALSGRRVDDVVPFAPAGLGDARPFDEADPPAIAEPSDDVVQKPAGDDRG